MVSCRELSGHKEAVVSLDCVKDRSSLNGNLLASSSEDKTARLWDVRTERSVRWLSDPSLSSDSMGHVRLHPREPVVILAHGDELLVYDLRQSASILLKAPSHKVSLGGMSETGTRQQVAVSSTDDEDDVPFTVNDFIFNPADLNTVVCPTDCGHVLVVDWKKPEVVTRWTNGHKNICQCVAGRVWSSDGLAGGESDRAIVEILSGGMDSQVCRWDPRSKKFRGKLQMGKLLSEYGGGGMDEALNAGKMVNPPFVMDLEVTEIGDAILFGLGNGAIGMMRYQGDRLEASPCFIGETHTSAVAALAIVPSTERQEAEAEGGSAEILPNPFSLSVFSAGCDQELILWRDEASINAALAAQAEATAEERKDSSSSASSSSAVSSSEVTGQASASADADAQGHPAEAADGETGGKSAPGTKKKSGKQKRAPPRSLRVARKVSLPEKPNCLAVWGNEKLCLGDLSSTIKVLDIRELMMMESDGPRGK
uniref:Uncharacterized protein n=1 Tax=Chromera velia CCMP2878 TaxID=1169474 RepID=A0A0G4I4M1_9ALVE|eukprot:Cvel_1797.t1-p1 / transcript=Cvel_1797.t1 / gene=Cvel_1797 / organism=Chromera_velia_CCMP2878 / gene_product=hypothetical protein / transcript_product=hypothetical protein / location=Cvel_scaffold66:51460-53563(+) / protein_length=481 / sequence_SO=supercontig / SO=protein_coding / is_pseudo=false